MEQNSKKTKIWLPALICIIIMTLICGIVYPLILTGIAQLTVSQKANGSVITIQEDGNKTSVGSELIGQNFTQPKYLIGRLDMGSPTNLSPVSAEQKALVEERIAWWHTLDPENKKEIPMELVTASASGVDPHISPSAAEYQVERIAKEREMSTEEVRTIIKKHTEGKTLGFLGEERVNVLLVNLELDGKIVE